MDGSAFIRGSTVMNDSDQFLVCVYLYIFVFVYYSIHPFFFLSGRILLKKMKMNKRYSGDADFCLLSL